MGFMGFKRPDGSWGIRNHVAVVSSVSCVNGVVNAIAREVPEVKAITHTEGCGRGLADIEITMRTLAGLGRNPNVSAVLIIGLGCEFVTAPGLVGAMQSTGKPVECLILQQEGGSKKTTAKGVAIVREMLVRAVSMRREECGWDNLVLGVECGGSDALSGVTANPLVGAAADWLVAVGGTVILSETTEMIGTEEILSSRASCQEIGGQVLKLIRDQSRLARDTLGPLADMVISPGNIEGGLSSIQEKSLGCIIKGGSSHVNEVMKYGATPSRKGLVLMDTPGSDIFSLTGMAAGGAQVMVFTTGRGTPAGFPIVPVIKISSNSAVYSLLEDDMDLNAGKLIEGVSLKEAAEELIDLIRRVADGCQTKAEANLQDCLSIHTVGPAF